MSERLFDAPPIVPRVLHEGDPTCEHEWASHWRAGAMAPYACSCYCGFYALTVAEVERRDNGQPDHGEAATAFGARVANGFSPPRRDLWGIAE